MSPRFGLVADAVRGRRFILSGLASASFVFGLSSRRLGSGRPGCESGGANASAVDRGAATLTTRRSVKKEYQAAWLVKAMTCIDLTTLAGDDTPGRVRRLCAKARRPLSDELLQALDLADMGLTVG